MVNKSLILSPLLLLPLWGQAQSMDAHTHGEANLDIALEGNQLMLNFVSPAANIYGFEHDAMNETQRGIVQAAMTLMEQPAWLIGDLADQCALESVELNAGVAFQQAAEAQDHQHAHEAHDHEHAHEAHEAHDHEHAHEAHAQDHEHAHEAHAEVVAEYLLSCSGAPGTLQVTAFRHFPAIEAIEVQWVSDSSQGGAELTARQAQLVFNAR